MASSAHKVRRLYPALFPLNDVDPIPVLQYSGKEVDEAIDRFISTEFDDLPLLMGTENRILKRMIDKALDKGHK